LAKASVLNRPKLAKLLSCIRLRQSAPIDGRGDERQYQLGVASMATSTSLPNLLSSWTTSLLVGYFLCPMISPSAFMAVTKEPFVQIQSCVKASRHLLSSIMLAGRPRFHDTIFAVYVVCKSGAFGPYKYWMPQNPKPCSLTLPLQFLLASSVSV